MKYLALDAARVKAEVASLIQAYPELAEDETLRIDMIEGETDAVKLIERALSERREAETMAAAIKERRQALHEREGRFERKADAMKGLIKGLMRAGNLHTLPLPEATIWFGKGRTSVNVLDPNELPQGFYQTIRKPISAAIKDALEAGEKVPGAELVTGEPSLTIRLK